MLPAYFQPVPKFDGPRCRGCVTCAHFHGRLYGGHVVCEHRGGVQIIGRPELGCAYWEREPGADDEWPAHGAPPKQIGWRR